MEELNLVFEDIANKSCKFIHVKKKSKKGKLGKNGLINQYMNKRNH
jgi:hypothetical protein